LHRYETFSFSRTLRTEHNISNIFIQKYFMKRATSLTKLCPKEEYIDTVDEENELKVWN